MAMASRYASACTRFINKSGFWPPSSLSNESAKQILKAASQPKHLDSGQPGEMLTSEKVLKLLPLTTTINYRH